MARQKEIDPGRVAVYIRWSTDDQGEGTTLEVQLEGCRHYILSQGWVFAEDLLFVDEGHSGGTLERPALRALRRAVQEGRIDCVVVFKLDRLSRSVVDTVRLVLEEWDSICHVKSAREPIDTASHAGKMFFYMLVSYAEWERAVIRERTFSGKLRRAQEGRNPGFRPPYGYRAGGECGLFAIEPAEAEVVKRIFALYRQGLGMIRIAARLNDEGLRFRGGRLWSESTVSKLLANPIYCGDLYYGRRSRNPNRGKRSGEAFYLRQEPTVIREDAVPPVVPRAEWRAVQALRSGRPGAARGTSGRSFSSSHLLTGLARCSCGHAVIAYRGGGKSNCYYRCSGQRSKGREACSSGYIRQDAVDRIVLEKFQQEFGDQVAQERYAARVQADAEDRLGRSREALAAANRSLSRLEEAEGRIRRLFRAGELTLEQYRAHTADMEAEGKHLRAQVLGLQRSIAETDAALALRLQEADLARRVQDVRSLPPEQQKHLLRHFVAAVTLFRDRGSGRVTCEVDWKWKAPRSGESQELALSGAGTDGQGAGG